MDVLSPPIIRIAGRCYRRNPVEIGNTQPLEEEELYTPTECNVYCDEACDADSLAIEETDAGYRLALNIPSAYFKFIIGKKGETKKKLENDTRTQIRIPRQGQEGDLVILGRDRAGVVSAKSRIDILVESARQKQPFTHFLSFPVNTDNIQSGLAEFKEDVLRFCDGDRGLDKTLFQNPKKLHLTLGTLALLNEAEILLAKQLLKDCYEDIVMPVLNGQGLKVQVQGLEYMNDDPGSVDVLYAQVQDPMDRLQELSDRLVDRFTSEGLMQRDYDRVKLHITVMNTLFRKDPTGTSVPKGRDRQSLMDRESFDATNVLKNYKDHNFGSFTINTVHLSERYSTGQDGYYACAAKLDWT